MLAEENRERGGGVIIGENILLVYFIFQSKYQFFFAHHLDVAVSQELIMNPMGINCIGSFLPINTNAAEITH